MKKALSLALVLVFSTAVSPGQKPEPNSAVDVYIQRARMQDSENRHDLAAANWKQVLLLVPDHPQALAALAKYYTEKKDVAQARIYLARLHAVQPDSSTSSLVGNEANREQELKQAAALSAAHRYQEALVHYRKVLGPNPTTGDWALAYYQTEAAVPASLPHAIEHLRMMVHDYPANPRCRLTLAKVLTYSAATRAEGLHMLQDFQGTPQAMAEAKNAWREALLWDPSSPVARESGTAYLQRYPDPYLKAKLDAAALASRRNEQDEGGPDEASGYRELAAGHLDKAEQFFSLLVNRKAKAGRGYLGLGFIAMQRKNFDAAVHAFEHARAEGIHTAELDSNLEEARFWLVMQQGRQALESGGFAEAETFFTQAEKLEGNRIEPEVALAGLYLKKQQPEKAIELIKRRMQSTPGNHSLWIALADAQVAAGQYADLLESKKKIPDAILARLKSSPDYSVDEAIALLHCGKEQEVEQVLAQMETIHISDRQEVLRAKLKLAQDRAEAMDSARALVFVQQVLREDTSNADAWRLQILVRQKQGKAWDGLHDLDAMPAETRAALEKDADFLLLEASLAQDLHEDNRALRLLEAAQAIRGDSFHGSTAYRLQLASLKKNTGENEEALQIYTDLAHEHPDVNDAWTGILSVLHALNRDNQALDLVETIPSAVQHALWNDAAFLHQASAVYSSAGDRENAVRALLRARKLYQSHHQEVSFGDNVQDAWTLLNAGDEYDLKILLAAMSRDRQLTLQERKQVEEVETTWAIRRAQKLVEQKRGADALQQLQYAQRAFPLNMELRRQTASTYMALDRPDDAYRILVASDFAASDVRDFALIVDAAHAARHAREARQWLNKGLEKYPENENLLQQGARIAMADGDLKQAEAYLVQLRDQKQRVVADADEANAFFSPREDAFLAHASQAVLSSAMPQGAEPGHGARSTMDPLLELYSEAKPLSSSSLHQAPVIAVHEPAATKHAPVEPVFSSSAAQTEPSLNTDVKQPAISSTDTREESEDALAVLQASISPWAGGGATVSSRSGEAGFDQLVRLDTTLEASTVIAKQARVTAQMDSVLLETGTASATPLYSYGSSGTAPTEAPYWIGVGGEVQLATHHLMASIGTTPYNFPVHNITGSLDWKPSAFVALFGSRGPVKESMLSYAGAKDPSTGKIWGGVVATEGGIRLSDAGVHSGMEAQFAYASLSGKNVRDNTRIRGSVNAWWKALQNPAGTLTTGVGMMGMHYDRNLQYFTWGQGGYFSPDSYLMFNVPFHWEGTEHRDLSYAIHGSAGVQNYNQGSVVAGSFLQTVDTAPKTAVNLSIDGRVSYRITPHLYIEAFSQGNNSYNYTQQTSGFALKFMLNRHPEKETASPYGLFDPGSIRPLMIP